MCYTDPHLSVCVCMHACWWQSEDNLRCCSFSPHPPLLIDWVIDFFFFFWMRHEKHKGRHVRPFLNVTCLRSLYVNWNLMGAIQNCVRRNSWLSESETWGHILTYPTPFHLCVSPLVPFRIVFVNWKTIFKWCVSRLCGTVTKCI